MSPLMERRRLAGNGPEVTRLGLGLAALGRPAYLNLGHGADLSDGRAPAELERQAHAVLDAAFAAGIRYFDAARSYGESERFLRAWLDARGHRRGAVVVGSKWGYRYTGGWQVDAEKHEVKDHSLAAFEEQWPLSEALLGEWLGLYQIHSATPDSGVLEDDGVLDALARLRDRGVRVGVTVSGTSQERTARRALEVARGGAALFASVQATWNVLEPSSGDALAEAHARGRTVIVKEALANGRLTARGDAGAAGPVATAARARGTTADAVALAAVLAQPWADVVLIGATTVEQLTSNLGALGVRVEAGELAEVREEAGAYWTRRAGMRWT
jgi:aryl-alcohol dehydrogenase-like predicted oxidoreductase